MSVGKAIRAALIACFIFVILYFVGGRFLGPGVGDFSESIVNGYEFIYTDRNGKMIAYGGKDRPNAVVISPRVDGYRVVGEHIFIVRRPLEIYKDGEITKSRLLDECEYWVINTESHQIEKVERSSEFQDLQCSGI